MNQGNYARGAKDRLGFGNARHLLETLPLHRPCDSSRRSDIDMPGRQKAPTPGLFTRRLDRAERRLVFHQGPSCVSMMTLSHDMVQASLDADLHDRVRRHQLRPGRCGAAQELSFASFLISLSATRSLLCCKVTPHLHG